MSVRGKAQIDISALEPDVARRRAGQIESVPSGARVELVVGPLAPIPAVVDLLRQHTERLRIEVTGEPYAVPKWLTALAHEGFWGWAS